jgi:16S rRNA (cytosine967-C5)-methyltransferase
VCCFRVCAVNAVENIAARVIAASEKAPADAVLREALKSARLSRAESARAAALVFAFFRWRGWLNPAQDLPERLKAAQSLDARFRAEPQSFSDQDLTRAVPEWVAGEVPLTHDWLVLLQQPPVLWLRAKRGTGAAVANALGKCTRGRDLLEDTLEYYGEQDLFRTPEFHAGAFEVQDVASQLVGLLCTPKPGETWWDACAGEGGKTLHLSDLMENKGLIWASDRSERRLAKLKQRAARAKAFNYRAAAWDGSANLPTKTKFDGVLVDAPCSGVGTWGRNPHARWTTTRDDVRELAGVQRQLILNASAAVKPGGRLIYAVCTLTRSETDAVADLCSQSLRGFAPLALPVWPNAQPGAESRKWFWPQTFRGNGMFVAAWQRLP